MRKKLLFGNIKKYLKGVFHKLARQKDAASSAPYSPDTRPWRNEDLMKTAVLGVGNILLKDEGVGVHVVNTLKQSYTFSPEVEIIDGGTLGLDLLPFIEGKERLLIIDAVNFGKEPGYIGILENEEIPSVILTKMSVHHIGLTDVLFAAKLLDIAPAHLCLIGIQPLSLDVGLDMTECIAGKVEELMAMAITKLKEWNITCVSQSPQELSA